MLQGEHSKTCEEIHLNRTAKKHATKPVEAIVEQTFGSETDGLYLIKQQASEHDDEKKSAHEAQLHSSTDS
jgi:hypothetical protein